MTYYSESRVRGVGRDRASLAAGGAPEVLRKAATTGAFDIFLSHSFRDAELILGVKEILESSGQTVYVDWINDPLLDRSKVVVSTAHKLRQRMGQCRGLVYASTVAATHSKWMPWELGFFDGLRGSEHVAIMPLVAQSGTHPAGQEYLGLYPLVREFPLKVSGEKQPFVTRERSGQLEWKTLGSLAKGSTTYARMG